MFVRRKPDILHSSREQRCQIGTPAVKIFELNYYYYPGSSLPFTCFKSPLSLAKGLVPIVDCKVIALTTHLPLRSPACAVFRLLFKFISQLTCASYTGMWKWNWQVDMQMNVWFCSIILIASALSNCKGIFLPIHSKTKQFQDTLGPDRFVNLQRTKIRASFPLLLLFFIARTNGSGFNLLTMAEFAHRFGYNLSIIFHILGIWIVHFTFSISIKWHIFLPKVISRIWIHYVFLFGIMCLEYVTANYELC